MEFRPILSTLLRNRTGALLIALQIALTMAVVINSVFIILDRAETMRQPLGIDEEALIVAHVISVGGDVDVRSVTEQDIRVLEAIDGVERVAKISTMPLSNSGSSSTYHLSEEPRSPTVGVAYYEGDMNVLETLGLEITRGRWFRDEEIIYDPDEGAVPAVTILSDSAAKEFFGDEDPLGRFIYTGTGRGIEVIGTMRMLSRPWYNWGNFYDTALMPFVEGNYQYVIRVDPARREALVPVIEQALVDIDPDRLVARTRTHLETIANTYARDIAMNRMLSIVMLLVVLITSLGIIGLASFSVAQRRRQIGTRRAIGARRYHILRYFLVENWLITSGGIALGLVLSFVVNHFLVSEYNMPKLDAIFLPLVAVGLWFIGLLATLGPARNAATIDPAIATRNV
ncbi:MAG: FtsX-like permease family protein [Pseudomonadota bacterium]